MDQFDRYIIDRSEEAHANVDIRDIFDSGFYGREEFFLFALGTGFFVAVFSLVVTIAGRQDTAHFAASVCIMQKVNFVRFDKKLHYLKFLGNSRHKKSMAMRQIAI